MKLTSSRSISRRSIAPSVVSDLSAMTMREPTVIGISSSDTAMSNDSVVTASVTWSPRIAGTLRRLESRLHTLRCGTRTPLGRPVEPDV